VSNTLTTKALERRRIALMWPTEFLCSGAATAAVSWRCSRNRTRGALQTVSIGVSESVPMSVKVASFVNSDLWHTHFGRRSNNRITVVPGVCHRLNCPASCCDVGADDDQMLSASICWARRLAQH